MTDDRDARPSREALIQEIRRLREALGEPADVEARVSGRNVSAVVDLAGRLGVGREALADAMSVDLVTARHPDAWIGWDDFNGLLERVRALAGDQGARQLGELAIESPILDAIGVVAGAVLTEEDLLAWVARVVFADDGLFFRGVELRVLVDEPGSVRVEWTSTSRAWFSRGFALAMAGTVSVLPRLVGSPRVEATLLTAEPHRVVVRADLPVRRGVLRWARAALRGRGATSELRAVYTEMVETNQRLSDKLRALEASREARRALARQLEARRHTEVLGRFASSLRDELSDVLAAISVHTERVASELADRVRRADVELLREAAERGAALVGQLHGRDEPGPERSPATDLHEVVARARHLLDHAAGPRHEVAHERGERPATARIDATRAEQVLVNLVLNARDATPDGGRLVVRTSVVALDAAAAAQRMLTAGAYVRLEVEDDGVGMDEATRARVFEPFFTTKAGGHGVGLATVWSAATSHGGAVDLDSAPGEGTRVRVYWPWVEPSHAVFDDAVADAKGRVLVVDHHDGVRAATARSLESAGYEVAAAASGAEALALIDEGLRPRLVISNVVTPSLSAHALGLSLRARLGPIPILLVSADGPPVEPPEPPIDYLAKPYLPMELVRRVGRLLRAAP